MSDRLHVLGFPHTKVHPDYATCAYTMRVAKFCKMMRGHGREVILYAPEGSEADCDEMVTVVTEKQQRKWFTPHDLNDLDRGGFKGQDAWQPTAPWWSEMNARIVGEMRKRMDKTDLLCLSQGWSQKQVVDGIPEMVGAEIMVGYRGIIDYPRLSPVYAAFESQSHRAMVYGEKGWQNSPRAGDRVIPNQFDPDELHFGDGGAMMGDHYLLFVGRLTPLKGIESACRVADALGMRLVVAGPGAVEHGPGYLRAAEGEWRCERLEYVGPVGIEERNHLMGGAACLMVPTWYAEPFGGVAVEAMMCGTPVASTDFGAFTETVVPGVSGYRFSTLQEAVEATQDAMLLDRQTVRDYAMDTFSLDSVRPLYEHWFENLDSLWGEGFASYSPRSLTA